MRAHSLEQAKRAIAKVKATKPNHCFSNFLAVVELLVCYTFSALFLRCDSRTYFVSFNDYSSFHVNLFSLFSHFHVTQPNGIVVFISTFPHSGHLFVYLFDYCLFIWHFICVLLQPRIPSRTMSIRRWWIRKILKIPFDLTYFGPLGSCRPLSTPSRAEMTSIHSDHSNKCSFLSIHRGGHQ